MDAGGSQKRQQRVLKSTPAHLVVDSVSSADVGSSSSSTFVIKEQWGHIGERRSSSLRLPHCTPVVHQAGSKTTGRSLHCRASAEQTAAAHQRLEGDCNGQLHTLRLAALHGVHRVPRSVACSSSHAMLLQMCGPAEPTLHLSQPTESSTQGWFSTDCSRPSWCTSAGRSPRCRPRCAADREARRRPVGTEQSVHLVDVSRPWHSR